MPYYRTEIDIPADRYVCLQLPAHLPPGRATVTITVHEPVTAGLQSDSDLDLDRQDIEWSDEFEDDPELEL